MPKRCAAPGSLAVSAVFFLLASAAGLFCSSCSPNPPELRTVSTRLIVYPIAGSAAGAAGSTASVEERLSCFLAVQDKDGIGDIEQVIIINDETELFWNLTEENWTIHKDAGEFWIGSNGLSVPEGKIPRGGYRVEVIDKAGEKTTRNFQVLAPSKLPNNLPQVISQQQGSVLVKSDYAQNTIFFLDAGNNVVKAAPVGSGNVDLSKLWGNNSWKTQVYSCVVYAYDIRNQIGFFSWKLTISK